MVPGTQNGSILGPILEDSADSWGSIFGIWLLELRSHSDLPPPQAPVARRDYYCYCYYYYYYCYYYYYYYCY